MAEKIFINGLISKDISDTTPDWILGRLSVKVEDLQKWLTENSALQDENGWINLTVKRSEKTGKRFIEVDTWKPTQQAVADTTNKLTGQAAEDNKRRIDEINAQYQKDLEEGKAMVEEIPF